jgi:hypothetical protein
MDDVRVLTPTDVDGQTVIVNSDNKLQAILADSRNSKVVDLATLNWTTYPIGAGMFQAVWEFGDTYKQPFMTQMATAPTSMATSNLIVYFHGLQNDRVTLVTTSGVMNGISAGQRKMFVRVEEGLPSAVVGNQPNTGTGITEQQFNTYLTQNLEIVEQVSNFYDAWGNWSDSPFGVRIADQQHMIDRVGRIKGTNWLVFGSSMMT